MWNHLVNLFFPKSCAGCHAILLSDEKVICTQCRHEIPLTNHHKIEENEIFQKLYGRIPLEFGAALFYFHKKGIVQEMMHQLKYKGNQEIGTIVGDWYASELKDLEQMKNIDYIIPVPLHKRRFRERGYNQVTTFGKSLAQNLNIPYEENVLQRKLYTKTQTKKSLLGRADINKTIFDVNFSENHHDKHFLLIDDVMTTGSTLEACSRELLKIPNAKISIVCMAMAHS
ncbi:ComF family protein [Flavobacterium sp. J49]|uniref:ComF family protein n=1 Tax=Flavobacterium sp. J49 TaxID=2718534 RepID=UPI0015948E45|nr:ComF family protein [Flavobacterium sp. J49]MBF6641341.1 ComF family protein [Flavobacterium sp. J49]NIC02588.1 ComF family protein [Flavobacterium sp. J49]